jgi:hypothetical protein
MRNRERSRRALYVKLLTGSGQTTADKAPDVYGFPLRN